MNRYQHTNAASEDASRSTARIVMAAGWLLGAMLVLSVAARAEVSGPDSRVIDSRIVSQATSTLFEYARHVEALAGDLDASRVERFERGNSL